MRVNGRLCSGGTLGILIKIFREFAVITHNNKIQFEQTEMTSAMT